LQAGIRVSDGLFVAAAGDVIISENGIYIVAATSYNRKNSVTFRNAGDTEEYLRLYVIATAGDNDVWLYTNAGTDRGATIYVNAVCAGSGASAIRIYSSDDNGTCNFYVHSTRANVDKNFFINESANANMTMGMTINQGANDDEILAFKSSDVLHGMTDNTETDNFAIMKKAGAVSGGLYIGGFKDSGGYPGLAIDIQGFLAENADATKNTSGYGIINLYAAQMSGTGVANVGADGNIVSFRCYRGGAIVTTHIFDEDGDFYYDGSTASYDEFDDALMAADLSRVLSGEWDRIVRYKRTMLERMRVVAIGEDGVPMVSNKRLNMLLLGAVGQLAQRCRALEMRLEVGNGV
jgi:hypothetical protein